MRAREGLVHTRRVALISSSMASQVVEAAKCCCIDVMQYAVYRSCGVRRKIVELGGVSIFFRTHLAKNLSHATSSKIKKGRKPPRSTEVACLACRSELGLIESELARDSILTITLRDESKKKWGFFA